MNHSSVRFGSFCLDPANRRLSRDGSPVELNARYLDVLVLLVGSGGELVTKDRFMDEIWRGVPVTDEALTQAIRTLRRTLGDSAVAPRYIETIPKHGYRFVAAVEEADSSASNPAPTVAISYPQFVRQTLAAMGGAMLAGGLVGLAYGFIGTAHTQTNDGGAISLLLVLVLVSVFSAGVSGAGIGAGMAASWLVQPSRWYWLVAGGALGGVTIGAFANLIGSDAFRLLFGQEVGEFAGAKEGFVLGSAVGLAAFLADQRLLRALRLAALLGGVAGLAIGLLDGRMMAGSLESLVSAFPSSRFRLEATTGLFGEELLGAIGHALTSAFEGAVFSAGVIWGLATAGSVAATPALRSR